MFKELYPMEKDHFGKAAFVPHKDGQAWTPRADDLMICNRCNNLAFLLCTNVADPLYDATVFVSDGKPCNQIGDGTDPCILQCSFPGDTDPGDMIQINTPEIHTPKKQPLKFYSGMEKRTAHGQFAVRNYTGGPCVHPFSSFFSCLFVFPPECFRQRKSETSGDQRKIFIEKKKVPKEKGRENAPLRNQWIDASF